jgi:hypothetical protein
VYGIQSHLVLSLAGGTVYGVQEGIYAQAQNLHGVQFGVVNQVERNAYGARLGAVNLSGGYSEGATFGIVNRGRRVSGLQLGLVNVADELHGIQIGLANIAKNGFLPFFPVVNAAM